MKHTIEQLKKILADLNTSSLRELLRTETEHDSGEPSASVEIDSDELRHHPLGDCFCGRTSKGFSGSGSFVDSCLTLKNGSGGLHRSVAVGAVIDDKTSQAVGELPVILAVGINYGQGYHYVGNPVRLVAALGMRRRLTDVFACLAREGCPAIAAGLEEFHLVGSNFFPWITDKSWSDYKFNSIEEAALIRCCGYADPVKYIATLISEIQPVAVVFHGANNAVPYLANSVINNCFGVPGAEVDVIFCDNLAPGRQQGILNAIRLGGCRLLLEESNREHLPFTPFDD